MCWKRAASIFNYFIATDRHEELAHLKRKIAEEKRITSTRSSNIKALLSSQLARKLSTPQVRRLKSAKTEADSFIEAFRTLEKELEEQEKAVRRAFLQLPPYRIMIFIPFLLWLVFTFEVAKNDWVLAGSALSLTGLYIYIYKFIEGKYIRPSNTVTMNKRLFSLFVYLNRWLFFIIFLLLEAVVLIEWELFQPESGEAVIVPFLLSFLAAIYLELANIQKALSFRIKWPEHPFWRNIAYTLYLYPVLYLFIHIIVYTFFAANDLLELNETLKIFLQALASGAIIASILAALLNLYFVKVQNWISKT